MRHVFKTLVLILIFVLQNTLVPYISILGVTPDILLAAVIIMALFSEPIEAGIYGAVTGTILDLILGRVYGFNTLAFLYIALAVRAFLEFVYKNRPVITAGITFVITIIYEIIYYFISYTIWGDGVFLYALFRLIIPTAAYTAAIQFLLYKPLSEVCLLGIKERGRRV